MKLRLLLLPLVAIVALTLGIRAQEAKKDDHTDLELKMEKAGGAWRKLRNAIADPAKKDENLKNLAAVRESLTAGLKFEPQLAAEKPAGAEREKFVAAYRERLKEQIAKVEKIEAALQAGNGEEAAKLYGAVTQDMKDAHSKFKKQKPKHS